MPILVVMAVLIIVLTVLGMGASDVHVIVAELSGIVTGYTLGKGGPPTQPV